MVLHANTKFDLQFMLNTCVNYFNYIGLDISVDGRDKSVYSSNTGAPTTKNEHLSVVVNENGKMVRKNLPYYESHESYKYLGLWINIDLNWGAQTRASNLMFQKYTSFLYKKCFNASQTAEILNLVIFPAITYRMNLIKYPDEVHSEVGQDRP